MRDSSPLPAPLDTQPFALVTARRLGVGRGRLRAADLSIPFRGTRVSTAERSSIALLAAAYSTLMPPHQVFSHWTAAVLLGLRLPEGGAWLKAAGARLDVAVVAPHRAPRRRGIRGHEIRSSVAVWTFPAGVKVTSPIDTWIALASEMSVDDLIVMGDGLVSRNGPRASLAELVVAVERAVSRPGVARLREALRWIRARTDSARETMLRLLIVRAGLPEPRVNGEIKNRFGAVIGHGDLVYREAQVLVEYDGRGHWENGRQFAVDIRRLDEFMEEGWRVIRVDKALMAQTATLLAKIRLALDQSGWTP
jgi:very-short-patch-repair endonuclease